MSVLINLKDAQTVLMKKSLYEFVKEMWDSYETSPFSDCWLIEYLCECFEYSIRHFLPKYCWGWWISDEEYNRIKEETGGICPVRDFILPDGNHARNHDLNIAPRHTKSSIFNVLGPAWAIINTPITVVSVSHSLKLSGEMIEKKQKLFNSDKYKYYFGNDIQLKLRKNTADHLELFNGGKTYSIAMDKFTGFGADCFVEDTLVMTKTGDKLISDIDVGEEVYSYNHQTDEYELSKVVAKRVIENRDVVRVETELQEFECTPDHRFYIEGRGYTKISDCSIGDELRLISRNTAKIKKISYIGKRTVYDIQVEPNNNFFANGALVHNCIINDDLISVADARRDGAVLLHARDYFKTTMPSRLNNKTTGVIWHIMQRIGLGDISDLINEDKGLRQIYSHTELQAIATHDQTFVYPCSGKVKEIKKGDLLWEERFGDYSQLMMEIGREDFETQYNQQPSKSRLNVIQDEYIHWIDEQEYEEFKLGVEFHYGSHDCPVKDKETSDFHGFVEGESRENELVITDAFEEHLSYIKEKELMTNLQIVDPAIIQIVEDKANGAALLQDLSIDVSGLVPFNPGTKSKTQRLELASIYMQQGLVRFRKTERVEELVMHLKKFPLLAHDDDVDAFSQLVIYHFTQRHLGVYSGAFNYQNIILEKPESRFHTYGATMNGETIKVVEVDVNNSKDLYTVTNEWKFSDLQSFEDFCRSLTPGCTVYDASPKNRLSSLITSVYNVLKFEEQDRDKSISILKAGFLKKKVLVSKDCKQTINDIARMRFTDAGREKGIDATESFDEGMSGCLRAVITSAKGYSQVWY